MAEMNWSMQFKRMFAANLDPDYSFKTKADLDKYLTSPLRYAGMIVYCEETDKLYRLSKALDKWEEISGSGIEIVDDYTKLSTTLTDYTICYVLNDYTDTTVTPNEEYSKGFYLYDKVSKTWGPISASGKIASNTVLGNVIIKKDGGIKVDSKGNIWIDSFDKTEVTDASGNKITTITIGGVTTTTTETPSGDVSEVTTIGGFPISKETSTDPTTGDTTTTSTFGDTTTTTVTSTDPGTGETTTSVVKKDTTTGTITEVTEKKDSSGNPISSTIVNKDNGGNTISSTTTTTETKTDPGTGDTITETTTENTNNSGITKTETTTKNETTGDVDTKTEYSGSDDMFASRDDIDNVYDDIFGDLGW